MCLVLVLRLLGLHHIQPTPTHLLEVPLLLTVVAHSVLCKVATSSPSDSSRALVGECFLTEQLLLHMVIVDATSYLVMQLVLYRRTEVAKLC